MSVKRNAERENELEMAKSWDDGGGETDWMGWPNRLGKWLLDSISGGDEGGWLGRVRAMQEGRESEQQERGGKGGKKEQMVKEGVKGPLKKKRLKGGMKSEVGRVRRIVSMIRGKEGTETGTRERREPRERRGPREKRGTRETREPGERRGAGVEQRTLQNITKLKRVQRFFEMVDHCNRFLDGMSRENSEFDTL